MVKMKGCHPEELATRDLSLTNRRCRCVRSLASLRDDRSIDDAPVSFTLVLH